MEIILSMICFVNTFVLVILLALLHQEKEEMSKQDLSDAKRFFIPAIILNTFGFIISFM